MIDSAYRGKPPTGRSPCTQQSPLAPWGRYQRGDLNGLQFGVANGCASPSTDIATRSSAHVFTHDNMRYSQCFQDWPALWVEFACTSCVTKDVAATVAPS